MVKEIIDKIESAVNQQVKEKFGLTDDQSEKTSGVFKEAIQNFLSSGGLKNPQLLQSALQNVSSLEDNEVVIKIKENIAKGLQEKVGLSPEIANAIKDFSIKELINTISLEFTDEKGNFDFEKILSKLNIQDLEQTAKDLLGNFGGLGNLFSK
ncbi:MAG: hypothetical protein LC105_06405 [Chitinophagales bacterium]|nr:hypothetical protein [Chitinophagales bacterium]MCZ2393467.1 hypothetical protein [Chitinophagales bacterium]